MHRLSLPILLSGWCSSWIWRFFQLSRTKGRVRLWTGDKFDMHTANAERQPTIQSPVDCLCVSLDCGRRPEYQLSLRHETDTLFRSATGSYMRKKVSIKYQSTFKGPTNEYRVGYCSLSGWVNSWTNASLCDVILTDDFTQTSLCNNYYLLQKTCTPDPCLMQSVLMLSGAAEQIAPELS